MEETTQANTDVCRQCGERPREKTKNGYIRPLCCSCHNKQRSPESIKRNRDKHNEYRKEYRQKVKATVVASYGGKCYCCGETNLDFLTIDHVNNDGAERKRKTSTEKTIFQHLYKREVDLDVYRVACFNCNCGRVRNNGVCPHSKAAQVE